MLPEGEWVSLKHTTIVKTDLKHMLQTHSVSLVICKSNEKCLNSYFGHGLLAITSIYDNVYLTVLLITIFAAV